MQTHAQHQTALELELALGDPFAPAGVFSFGSAVALDEQDAYPEEACALLDALGFYEYYIPSECGGKLTSFEEFVALLRVIARRDLTAAIGHGKTFLGAVAAWVGGSDEQKRRLAAVIRRGSQVALALTEQAHGSDLLSSEVEASKVDGGYSLRGEKWLINNATRARALTVFARTGRAGDPRGFSLFFVEKNDAHPTFACLPKIKTHGIRGADISGIRFDGAFAPDDALVGREGAGLEIILKAFQLTRTVIPGLSLGAADTALRVTMEFALARKLYGDSVFAIPHARMLLCDAFIDLLMSECVTVAAARSLHVEPEQMSLRAAVSKYFVPTTVEKIIKSLSVVLGARQYLRQEHCFGIFQKVYRDNAILSLFDGSTSVNLSAIASHLGQLARNGERAASRPAEVTNRLATLFSLSEPLPDFDAAALALHNHGRDSIIQGLADSIERLASLSSRSEVEEALIERVRGLARELLSEVAALNKSVADGLGEHGLAFNKSAEMFEQAERYCALVAGACCLHLWVYSRDSVGGFFAEGDWLVLSLARLLRKLGRDLEDVPPAHEQRVAEELKRLHEERQSFSVVPLPLAQPDPVTV
ncbi:MAG TPA: acyl-CoA dehydrogenase family protein [Pyrinomonadaceae bacterium]|nr:acyl-CoA dehydrogenase family protein [Pyrinomonadaceae bacterium]